jgi:hypothetical protein
MTAILEAAARPGIRPLHHITVRTTRGARSVGVIGAYRDTVRKDRVIVILDRPAADGMPDDEYGYLSILANPVGQLLQRPEARIGAAIEAKAGSDAIWPVHESSPVLTVEELLSLPAGTPYPYDLASPYKPSIVRLTDEEIQALPGSLMALVEFRHEGAVYRW